MFEKVKRCTGSFSCRFRTVLIATAIVIAVAVALIVVYNS